MQENPNEQKKSSRGKGIKWFTLLELMASLAVFGVILTLILRYFFGAPN